MQLGRALGAVTGQLADVASGRSFELQVTLRGTDRPRLRWKRDTSEDDMCFVFFFL